MRLKHILMALVLIVAVFIAVLVVKTALYPFNKAPENVTAVSVPASEKALQRLAGGLRIPTISNLDESPENYAPFDEFKRYLENAYPAIYDLMQTDTVNDYALIFYWRGANNELAPLLITSHYDVAPAEYNAADAASAPFRPNDEAKPPISGMQTAWEFPPFAGAVANGRIYGRGTLDDKGQFFAIMEAADSLIAAGFAPQRDIWFAFGHDEELGGREGALALAQYFKDRDMRFDAVHDEGGIITSLAMLSKSATRPVAVVGVAEKGFLVVKITVRGQSGHTSMPPRNTANALAAELITKLEANQMPARLIMPMSAFLDKAGGEMGYMARMAIANRWLMEPAILKLMGGNPASNALVRTTTAVSMVKGGEMPNVLSPTAEIIINFRILPGDTPEGIVAHVEKICRGYDVEIATMGASVAASHVSPADSHAFKVMEQAVLKIYPNGIVSPYVTVGATDAYKYEALSDNVYRFMPAFLNQYELALMHGVNEYISIENYAKMIAYYQEFIRNYK